MAPPLKDMLGPAVVRSLGADLRKAWRKFDAAAFERTATRGLEGHELLARGDHLADAMRAHLPDDVAEALAILERSFGPVSGVEGETSFRYLPHASFVSRFGLAHFDRSMAFQRELTRRFTAEFSIRAFLAADPERTFAVLRAWARDPDVHVRRLVSEGTRPRLPWAKRVPVLLADPEPGLALLEMLKDDPERYVQRSVANHLNDVTKDHPARVLEIARRWSKGASSDLRYVVAHGLRTLVKAGDAAALSVLGAGARPHVEISSGTVFFEPKRVAIGGKLRFAFTLRSRSTKSQELVVDYAVHFVKKDGTARPKVFKLRRLTLPPRAAIELRGTVSFAVHSTRKPNPGRHVLDVRVNGVVFPLGTVSVR